MRRVYFSDRKKECSSFFILDPCVRQFTILITRMVITVCGRIVLYMCLFGWYPCILTANVNTNSICNGGSTYQREGMGLLDYQAMPSLRNVAHGGVLCTFSNRSTSDRGKWCGRSGKAVLTVYHVQNHTLLGQSPAAIQAGRRVRSAL